ncbi:hypothetical protein ACHAWF_015439 [Thalassiosira exigua]
MTIYWDPVGHVSKGGRRSCPGSGLVRLRHEQQRPRPAVSPSVVAARTVGDGEGRRFLGAEPSNLLTLRTNDAGVRGVFLNDAVAENDIILSMPLDACMRDDEPPSWLRQSPSKVEERDAYSVSVEGWVTRLAASLLDTMQNREERSEAVRAWLDLLPTDLREALPVHWDEADVARAGSRALEVASQAMDRRTFASWLRYST